MDGLSGANHEGIGQTNAKKLTFSFVYYGKSELWPIDQGW